MNWIKLSDYCIRTEDQQYTITKNSFSGKIIYTLWHLKTMLGDFDSKQLAVSEYSHITKQVG